MKKTGNPEPIYDFGRLKDYLVQRGFVLGNRNPYEVVNQEDVTPEDLKKGTIRFETNGIFVKDESGREHQVFLYKRDYRLERYGKPRFHICRCRVIDEFITSGGFNDHYRRTNSEPVMVANMDNGYLPEEVDELPLCKFCGSLIRQYGTITSREFVETLREANGGQEEQQELDLFGYTRDWDSVSREYRTEHNYTCEVCGLKIEDDYDRQYMHVHHVNGDKLNNDESNLKCLCLYCHAHVDEHHYKRLTTGANKFAYVSFVDRYGDEGYWPLSIEVLDNVHKMARLINEGKMTTGDGSAANQIIIETTK